MPNPNSQKLNLNLNLLCVSAYHCVELLLVHNTAQNSSDNLPSFLVLQTIINASRLALTLHFRPSLLSPSLRPYFQRPRQMGQIITCRPVPGSRRAWLWGHRRRVTDVRKFWNFFAAKLHIVIVYSKVHNDFNSSTSESHFVNCSPKSILCLVSFGVANVCAKPMSPSPCLYLHACPWLSWIFRRLHSSSF